MRDSESPPYPRIVRRVAAAAIAGIFAGVLMGLVLSFLFAITGRPPLLAFRLLSGTTIGEAAMLPDPGWVTLLVGFLAHLGYSALLGALFGLLALTRLAKKPLWTGLLYGTLIWIGKEVFLYPAGIDLTVATRMPDLLYWIAHLSFGLGLLGTFGIERYLMRRDLSEETGQRAA